jgi:hypothetical protein
LCAVNDHVRAISLKAIWLCKPAWRCRRILDNHFPDLRTRCGGHALITDAVVDYRIIITHYDAIDGFALSVDSMGVRTFQSVMLRITTTKVFVGNKIELEST